MPGVQPPPLFATLPPSLAVDSAGPSVFGSRPDSHRNVEGVVHADSGFPPAFNGVVPADNGFPPAFNGVVPADSGVPMETVHTDLAGPYEASVGGSVCLIMFVDSTSRWMQPYGMRNNQRPPVRAEVRRQHERHVAAALLPYGQRQGVY